MSPLYLYQQCSPGAIRKLIPNAKLIAILRDPAERAYSHFCHNRRDGHEPLADFAAALDAEEKRIAKGWWSKYHYRNHGYYARQLRRYLEFFPREQIADFGVRRHGCRLPWVSENDLLFPGG